MIERTYRKCLPPVAILAALAAVAVFGWNRGRAGGQDLDLNTAGSLQGSYVFVPTDPRGRDFSFDGFTTEAAFKLSADLGDNVSAQVKMCFGCHGFELGMAFVDLRADDGFNVRVGRFSPSFGDFQLRHDPANHRTIDKPLAYDMGRMLRLREWNMSVMPVPYIDHGLEISGTHWFDDNVQIDYALYAVGGFRGPADAYDIDWTESREPARYYIDNNSVPTFGARLGLALRLSDDAALTVAVSGMYGFYDPEATLSYAIAGLDAYLRLGPVTFRSEYVIRRTEMYMGDNPETRFAYAAGSNGEFDNWFLKDGWFLTTEIRVHPMVEVVARFDGMRRIGNVAATSPLRSTSLILRYTAGLNVIPDRTFRIKLFGQFYDFSDFSDAVTVQAAGAASF